MIRTGLRIPQHINKIWKDSAELYGKKNMVGKKKIPNGDHLNSVEVHGKKPTGLTIAMFNSKCTSISIYFINSCCLLVRLVR